jgi:hypothetical protein
MTRASSPRDVRNETLLQAIRLVLAEVSQVKIEDDEFERIKPLLESLLNSLKTLDEIDIPMEVEPASYLILGGS